MLAQETSTHINCLYNEAIGALRVVHRRLGPDKPHYDYMEALAGEFSARELLFERTIWLPEHYKGITLKCGHCVDFLIDDCLVVQVISVDELTSDHEKHLHSTLRRSNRPAGILFNFRAASFEEGLKKIGYYR